MTIVAKAAGLAILIAAALTALPAPAQSAGKAAAIVNAGHSSSVREVVFSPDGRWLASSAWDEAIKLWDVASGRLLRTIAGKVPEISQLTITPDGKRVVAYGKDSLHVWDAETGAPVRDIAIPTYELSPTRYGVTAQDDIVTVRYYQHKQRMNRWNLDSGRHLGEFRSDDIMRRLSNGISSFSPVAMSVSPDSRWLVLGYSKETKRALGRVELLDPDTGRLVRTFDSHSDSITSAVISRDGRLLASASRDKTVKVWDVAGGRLLRTLSGHGEEVQQVSFSPDGRRIVSGSTDKSIRIWDTDSGAALRTIQIKSSVYTVAFSPDGRLIASEGESHGVSLWDAETGALLRSLGGSADDVTVQTVGDDRLVTMLEDGRWVRSWSASSGQLLETRARDSDKFGWPRVANRFPARGPPSIVFQDKAEVKIWNAQSGRTTAVPNLPNDDRVKAIAPGGDIIIRENYRGKSIEAVDAATGRSKWSAKLPDTALNYAFSPDGRRLVGIIRDKNFVRSIHGWDAGDGRPSKAVVDPDSGLNKKSTRYVAYSPDGRKLIGWGDALRIYDADSRRKLWEGQGSELTIAAVSPDSRLAVAAGKDTSVTVWDIATGRRLHSLAGSPGAGKSITFLQGGRQVVIGNSNGTSAIWATDTGDLLASTVHAASGEWVTITPEGFFIASDKGGEFLHVVRGFETVGIDQVYQSLYRPDLVREKLAGDPKGLVREAAAKLDLDKVMASGAAPQVRLISPKDGERVTADEIAIAAEISDRGGGIGRIEWRVNGVTLGVATRGLGRADENSRGRTRAVAETLPLDPGDNTIELVAYNSRDLIASMPAAIRVVREAPAQPASPPHLHVLAVGVNDYYDSRLRLTYAVPDAKVLAAAMTKAGEKLYDRVEITTVLDADATAANLDKVFADLRKRVRPSDVFVFFLAGHGKTVDGRYYFLPHDFRYQGEESIARNGVGQDRWQEWFARIPARKSVLLYDTCESGTLTGDRVAQRGLERVAALDRLTQAMGRTVLTASTDDAPALEGYRGHGIFTYALLDALDRADTNGNGTIEVTELAAHVDRQVPELSFQAFKLRQIPQMKIAGSNFPLAGRMAVLAAGDAPTVTVSTRPTHVIVAPAALLAQPGGATVRTLAPGTAVTLMRTEAGWTLVARDGAPLGYVAAKDLLPIQ